MSGNGNNNWKWKVLNTGSKKTTELFTTVLK